MPVLRSESVLSIHHWNDRLFSFRTTRDPGFRFRNGQFIMLGLQLNPRPLTRAYSIASPNYADHMEFLSIKVDGGALTSKLQAIKVGDELLISSKPVGTLVIDDLSPGRRLFLLATGTGLAPYMSTIQDPETFERFEKVILVHCVRRISDLAYREFITKTLPRDEYLGDMVARQLLYYPAVTREPFEHGERIPGILLNGQLCRDLGEPPIDPTSDRAMICGSMPMLIDTRAALEELGMTGSPQQGVQGDFVFERAFVEG